MPLSLPKLTRKMTLGSAYQYCKEATHRYGPHFSIGFRFLPKRKRDAIYAIYAACRFVDDCVDEPVSVPPAQLLKRWETEIKRCYRGSAPPQHPVLMALHDAILRYPIPQSGFLYLIRGCRMDLHRSRYATFAELEVYCDHVATTIRDLSLPVFGCADPRGGAYGRALALALQLTNIARDVGEDLDRNRIYLPLDELARAGYSERELIDRVKNKAFLSVMTLQCRRIRRYFEQAKPLIARVEADSRLALSLMYHVYLALVARIEADPFCVLDHSIRLSMKERKEIVKRAGQTVNV